MIELNHGTYCNMVYQNAVNDCAQQLMEFVVSNLSKTFKALADPTRIGILYNLSKRELCVCDLA